MNMIIILLILFYKKTFDQIIKISSLMQSHLKINKIRNQINIKGKPKKESDSNSNQRKLMNILSQVLTTIMEQSAANKNKNTNRNYQYINHLKNPDFDDDEDEFLAQSQSQIQNQNRSIIISNIHNLQKSKFGEEFKLKLDARDQVLAHPFSFQLKLTPNHSNSSFLQSQQYQRLTQFIEEYLVDVVENVVSVSFNFLINNQLKQSESKDYASKNILLNAHSIIREIIQTLDKQKIIDKDYRKKLSFALAQLVDQTLKNALQNLSAYYPQAPPTGGTPRMREALLTIDRNSTEQFDFLVTQNLKIQINSDNDYTEYILKVVNKAVQITGYIDPNDPLQQTLFQKFVSFSQNLFWLCQQDSYSNLINKIQRKINPIEAVTMLIQNQSLFPNENQAAGIEGQGFCNLFGNQIKDEEIKQQNFGNRRSYLARKSNMDHKQKICSYLKKSIFDKFKDTTSIVPENNKQKRIQEMRKNHDFLIGQKVPISVKPMSKKDLEDKNLSAKNSAVLRMLTKWAENLQNIFDNPQVYTTNRNTPFKTIRHEIVYPSKSLKQQLYKNIIKSRPEKEKIKRSLITRNTAFQGQFFSKHQNVSVTKFIKRYTQTRIMASKMNSLLIQFMKQYISHLIHLLLQSGKVVVPVRQNHSEMNPKQYEIDLVIFRIGDLMRSKTHCSETTFIRILKTLYYLDQKDSKVNPLFTLVRIKNKLDSKDNNILINYLFMGKLQCQLQLSVQKISGKQQHYYSFAHFLYQLTRGKFGVLSQCATIISQHDPIISYFSAQNYYQPKKAKVKTKQKMQQRQQANEKILQSIKNQSKARFIFICQKCNGLKIQQNMDLFERTQQQSEYCNQCIIDLFSKKQFNKPTIMDKKTLGITQIGDKNEDELRDKSSQIQGLLKNKKISKAMLENIKSGAFVKVKQFSEMKQVQYPLLFLSINHLNNRMELSFLDYINKQNMYYISRLSEDLLKKTNIESQDLQIEIISGSVRKLKFSEFTYELDQTSHSVLNIVNNLNFFPFQLSEQKLLSVWKKGVTKIMHDKILNVLKHKNQTMQLSLISQKYNHVADLLYDEDGEPCEWVIESLSNIYYLYAEQLNLEELNPWMEYTEHLKILNLNSNKIKDLSLLRYCQQLKSLYIANNQINEDTDWSMFPKLQYLDLFQNKLDFIDMSKLPRSLLSLDLGYNELAKLDLFGIPSNLKKLNLYHNYLAQFDFMQLPGSLQQLNLGSNNLKILKYQTFPKNIMSIDLSHNQLTQINITWLEHIKECFINDNQISTIKISNCPALQKLNASNNLLIQFKMESFPSFRQLNLINQTLLKLTLKDLPALLSINVFFSNPNQYQYIQITNVGFYGIKVNEGTDVYNLTKNQSVNPLMNLIFKGI